jgi:peptidoglycan/xylan/chitin deacetylase (PgdA/CDA1 family)
MMLFKLGFVRLWCALRKNRITIITFHGVMDTGVDAEWEPLRPRISRRDFDKSLSLFKRYFNFIPMKQAVDILQGNIPPVPNCCVITFDDGHLNNINCALPILRKHKIPVVFYPSIEFINSGGPYWFDRLDFAIQQPNLDGVVLRVGKVDVIVDQSSRASVGLSLSNLIKQMKRVKQSNESFRSLVDSITLRLEEISGKSIIHLKPGDNWSAAMSWDQLIECSMSADVEIGSHTVHHVRLSRATEEEVRFELQESKQSIEDKTGQRCDMFCFPNGDWSMKDVELLRETGYVSAVTSDSGSNVVGDNLYLLKRYSVPNAGSAVEALFAIAGIFHFKSWLVGKIVPRIR